MADEDPWAFDDAGAGDSDQKSATPAAIASAAGSAPGSAAPAAASAIASAAASEVGSLGGGKEAVEDAALQEAEAPPPPPPEDDGYRKPVTLFRHWVRPKFLQYKYMYNYRTNYYDDVIDYLDKKQVGVAREIPRPQTWAERVLRSKNITDLDMYTPSGKPESHLIQNLAASVRGYNYHTKAYLNQKYGHVI